VELPRLLPVSALQRVRLAPRPVPGATGPPGVTWLVTPAAAFRLLAAIVLIVDLAKIADRDRGPLRALRREWRAERQRDHDRRARAQRASSHAHLTTASLKS